MSLQEQGQLLSVILAEMDVAVLPIAVYRAYHMCKQCNGVKH